MALIPITPLSTTKRYAVATKTQVFTADRSVTWSASGGATVQPAVGVSTTVSFPNKTQTVVVSAVSGGDSGNASLIVYGTWPVFPHFGYEVPFDDKTLVSYAEDGSAVFRRKGNVKLSWSLNFNNTPTEDLILMRDFWNHHRKDTPFYFEDLELPENVLGVELPTLKLVTADSGLRVVVEGPDRYTVSVSLKEV
jgi:hypothetical protein